MNLKTLLLPAALLPPSFAAPLAGAPDPDAAGEFELENERDSASVVAVLLENDALSGTDRHYTNGLKIAWLSGDLSTWDGDSMRGAIGKRLPMINRPDRVKNFGIALGQNIYTPQDVSRVVPDPLDRPYAGWSYAEFSFASRSERTMDAFTLQLGIVGPGSRAEQVQRIVHEWLNSERPLGWDSQLENEFGVNIVFDRRHRWFARTWNDLLGLDLLPHAGLSLGNVATHAKAGATVRFGYRLPSDFGVDLIRPTPATIAPLDSRDVRLNLEGGFSLFFFAGVEGRAVARDIFLDGNTFADSPSVDKKPFVGDAFGGIGFSSGSLQLAFSVAVRSLEFEGQDEVNRYGSASVSWTF